MDNKDREIARDKVGRFSDRNARNLFLKKRYEKKNNMKRVLAQEKKKKEQREREIREIESKIYRQLNKD